MEKGIRFLTNAVKLSISNYPAIADLLNTFLRDPQEYKIQFDRFTSNILQLKRENLPESELSGIQFAQGCMEFMTGNKTEAMKYWILAQQSNPKCSIFAVSTAHRCRLCMYNYNLCFYFQGLSATSNRHKWDRNLISIPLVRSAFTSFLKLETTEVSDAA